MCSTSSRIAGPAPCARPIRMSPPRLAAAVITDLLESRVGAATLRLVIFALDADRASEFVDDVTWLADRSMLRPGAWARRRCGAGAPWPRIERVDGYATALLEDIPDNGSTGRRRRRVVPVHAHCGGIAGAARRLIRPRRCTPSTRRGAGRRPPAGPGHSHDVRLAAYATQVGRPRDYEALLGAPGRPGGR